MNIIEKVRDIVQRFPKISEVVNSVHIDFTDSQPTSYGLSPTGDKLLAEDVLGNLRKQHGFLLFSTFGSMNDYERLANSSVLLELSDWLRNQTGEEVETLIDGKIYTGEITKLTAENGTLLAVPEENGFQGVQYQLQIIAEYTVKIF